MVHQTQDRRFQSGFTLMELIAVVLIIGMLAALAIPQFMPIIAFTELEGNARHLAGYGRAAMAHATMMRTEITVYVDLEQQEYFITQMLMPEPEGGLAGGEGEMDIPGMDSDQYSMFADLQRSGFSQEELNERLATGDFEGLPENFNPDAMDMQMNDAFTKFAEKGIRARAKNVVHEEGLLDGIGDFFDDTNMFTEELEPVEEELKDDILNRTRITGAVTLESVTVNCKSVSTGLVDFKIGPLGLSDEIRFFLVNEEDEHFTVIWDPLSGGSNVLEGHEAGDC